MIPKIIHYCWFGGNDKPELVEQCIQSWKRICPDYKLMEWNESNFNVNCIPYVSDAYADQKWAFVSNYARLYIIYNYGGIYLDTDVLLHHSLDKLLIYDCWLASDDVRYISTGLGFGAKKGHPLIKCMMDAHREYKYPFGTNVTRDTPIVERELPQWKKSNKSQQIDDILLIGLNDYGKYAKHLYTYTWADETTQKNRKAEIIKGKNSQLSVKILWKIKCFVRSPKIISYFDSKRGYKREKIYTFLAYDLLDCGLLYYIKRTIHKFFKKHDG